MIDKLTGNIADTSDWAHALEKRVTNGTKTTICQSGREWPFHHDGAVPGFRDFPADVSGVSPRSLTKRLAGDGVNEGKSIGFTF
jgi:hypothetical protein